MSCFQVLCPKCDVGSAHQKSRCKKAKDAAPLGKRSPSRLESLCDVEKALSESRDSASAVSEAAGFHSLFFFFCVDDERCPEYQTVCEVEMLNKNFN